MVLSGECSSHEGDNNSKRLEDMENMQSLSPYAANRLTCPMSLLFASQRVRVRDWMLVHNSKDLVGRR